MSADTLQLWILGLGHSGTTAFWRSFRRDDRLSCFDEPFTRSLGSCFPQNNSKKTFDEYIVRYGKTPEQFWSMYRTLSPLEELDQEFTPAQEQYLRSIFDLESHVVADEIRLHRHLPALARIFPRTHVIHLWRRASGFVSSNLRPSLGPRGSMLQNWARKARDRYNQSMFWTRRDFPPGLRRDEVTGAHPDSKFGLLLKEAGFDADRIMGESAVIRLLAYWLYHYRFMTTQGPSLLGDAFRTVSYDVFATSPNDTFGELYPWLGLGQPQQDLSFVHPPKPAFQEDTGKWQEAAQVAGFTEQEMAQLL
ncbi:MAG: hypothetical protein MK116_08130 [Phycisphaerales bacterium]|nr:hypothetical protein [Phycisphaerales bacterium]